MALTLYVQVSARMISMQAPLFTWAGHLILGGTLLGLGAVLLGGLPLVISAWRSTPRSRFLFLVPFLAVVLTFAVIALGTFLPDPVVRSALFVTPLLNGTPITLLYVYTQGKKKDLHSRVILWEFLMRQMQQKLPIEDGFKAYLYAVHMIDAARKEQDIREILDALTTCLCELGG